MEGVLLEEGEIGTHFDEEGWWGSSVGRSRAGSGC